MTRYELRQKRKVLIAVLIIYLISGILFLGSKFINVLQNDKNNQLKQVNTKIDLEKRYQTVATRNTQPDIDIASNLVSRLFEIDFNYQNQSDYDKRSESIKGFVTSNVLNADDFKADPDKLITQASIKSNLDSIEFIPGNYNNGIVSGTVIISAKVSNNSSNNEVIKYYEYSVQVDTESKTINSVIKNKKLSLNSGY